MSKKYSFLIILAFLFSVDSKAQNLKFQFNEIMNHIFEIDTSKYFINCKFDILSNDDILATLREFKSIEVRELIEGFETGNISKKKLIIDKTYQDLINGSLKNKSNKSEVLLRVFQPYMINESKICILYGLYYKNTGRMAGSSSIAIYEKNGEDWKCIIDYEYIEL
jgi:hypothetical protein